MVSESTQVIEGILAFLNIVAGCLCFLLDKRAFADLEDSQKTPMYVLVACSITFVAVYIVIDTMEGFYDVIQD